jgi:hypothetical protein
VQFDHIKRAKDCLTMAIHIYDPVMRLLLMIAVCEFSNEKHDS